jgi:two-component system phosphate regulon response regulator PhoB
LSQHTHSTKVLVIDDESSIRELIAQILSAKYQVRTAASGLEGVRLARHERPDVVLLDILMPGDDGLACLQELRARPETAKIPVLMLTALNEPHIRIRAFNYGADDFIAKPFNPDELIARIDSKVNRFQKLTALHPALRLGDVAVDLGGMKVTSSGHEIPLEPIEFKILCMLIRQHDRLTRREELESFVWPGQACAKSGLEPHIVSLRQKLQSSDLILHSVYGAGYTLSVKSHVH